LPVQAIAPEVATVATSNVARSEDDNGPSRRTRHHQGTQGRGDGDPGGNLGAVFMGIDQRFRGAWHVLHYLLRRIPGLQGSQCADTGEAKGERRGQAETAITTTPQGRGDQGKG
jgi:hypothetical protein